MLTIINVSEYETEFGLEQSKVATVLIGLVVVQENIAALIRKDKIICFIMLLF